MTKPNERLITARKAAGFLGASEAARRFGWQSPTYLAHENGSRNLKPDTAKLYADAFHVSPEWLLYGDGAGPGMSEPAGSAPQRPLQTHAARVLANLDAPSSPEIDIKIGIHGRFAQIIATVDRESLSKLRQQLDLIEKLMDD